MTVICPNPIVMLQLFVYHLHLASQIHDFVDWERINPDGQVWFIVKLITSWSPNVEHVLSSYNTILELSCKSPSEWKHGVTEGTNYGNYLSISYIEIHKGYQCLYITSNHWRKRSISLSRGTNWNTKCSTWIMHDGQSVIYCSLNSCFSCTWMYAEWEGGYLRIRVVTLNVDQQINTSPELHVF